MDELNIKPINNVDVEESGDAGIQICIVKCKGDTCDSCDGICFMHISCVRGYYRLFIIW